MVLLAVGCVVMVLSSTLGSADVWLDQTAARRWPIWRAAHIVVMAVVAYGVVVVSGELAGLGMSAQIVVRDVAGFAGLAGDGVAVFGRSLGWAPLFTVLLVAFLVAGLGPGIGEFASWPTLPVDNATATAIAAVLGASGWAGYSLWGYRRV